MSVSYDDDETALLALCKLLLIDVKDQQFARKAHNWIEDRYGEDQRRAADVQAVPLLRVLVGWRSDPPNP